METTKDWEKIIRRLELLMRLKSFPVAFKLVEKKADLTAIPFMRRPEQKMTMCQMVTLVRNFDWTIGADLDDFMNPMCPSIIGLADTPEICKDGIFRTIVWVKTKEDGRRYEENIPRIPSGRYEAVVMGPLVYNPFDPDIVLIYANPAQMILLINSLQFEDYKVMEFFCVGESSCSDAIARCYLHGKPSLTIPCYGERRYGHAQDDELVMAVPAAMMEKALRGMETLYRRGIRYPISYAGAEMDVSTAFPVTYRDLNKLETVKGTDGRMLIGVTGGIASGKTTVAEMLEKLGAFTIDFDVLARKAVEPGSPAWNKIVEYFGRQVLQSDDRLDRKKLSNIVFHDLEKRKKLESFIHPRIEEYFIREVNDIACKKSGAIIQVVVPLLIELNLQYQFHKIIIAYIPPELQVERLAKRDGISAEEAANMLKAQLPIDEKLGYADYVVYNESSLDETWKRVQEMWKLIKREQDKLK